MTIHRHRLDNGLRVLLHQKRDLPLVAVNLWYHVGSKNERPGRTGFAHLFEHMLFQGSENVAANDHFRYVQQVGGVANGSTWYDRTNYYETLPAHQLELGLWLESDRMGFLLPAMTEEKLENQRSVVMNERRQRVDNQPYGLAFERLHELLYPADHPYHWPVIGYMEDIEAATLDDVSQFFATYYGPGNTVLTLAGDFELDEALQQVEKYFGGLPATAEPPRPDAGLPPALEQPNVQILGDQVRLPRIYMAWATPAYGTETWYAASLLGSILTDGKASRFYRDLVYTRQIAQSVSCSVFPTEECATFVVVATAKADGDLEELRDLLLAGLQRVGEEGVDDAERDRALSLALTGHYNELQSLDNLADNISAAATFFDEPERAMTEPDSYAAVQRDDMAAFARDWLHPERWAGVAVVPASDAVPADDAVPAGATVPAGDTAVGTNGG